MLEVGAGAAQCSRWLLAAGAEPVALDLSAAMLRRGRSVGVAAGLEVPLVQGDAAALPFADRSFDLACSAYGGVPFVDDSARVMREVARVLRPGGRWVFSVTHPLRWCFPDDPGPRAGLVARHSYFDRTPYVEQDADGAATYVEHHRTLGDRVREISAAGLRLLDVVEPEWPAGPGPDLGRLEPAARAAGAGDRDLRLHAGLSGAHLKIVRGSVTVSVTDPLTILTCCGQLKRPRTKVARNAPAPSTISASTPRPTLLPPPSWPTGAIVMS